MKKNVIRYVFSLMLLLLVTSSCNKADNSDEWQATVTHSSFNSMGSIFQEVGANKLRNAINGSNSIAAEMVIKNLASQIVSYFVKQYNVDLRIASIGNPEGLVILGIAIAEKEYQQEKGIYSGWQSEVLSVADPSTSSGMSCFVTAVSTLIGLSQAKAIWADIVAANFTVTTAVEALTLIGKRVAGVIAVACMVYSAGECLGWW